MQEIAAALGLQQDLCPCWGIIQAQNLSRGIGRRFRASEVLYEPPSRADAGLEKLYGFGSFGVLRSKGLGLGATLKSLECNVKSL